MSDDVVLYELRDPGIAILTLNRPDSLNGWTGEMGNRYFELLRQCAADPAVRVIVVTGAGRGFCAGADMNSLVALGDGDSSQAAGIDEHYYTTQVPKPVIAAINGACAGMGLSQALMCDIRFVATTAKITTAFAKRGLIAELGLSWTLQRLVGLPNAADLLFSSRVILGDEAARMGLANAAVEPETLMEHTLAYATDIALNVSPSSIAVMKRQLWADAQRELIPGYDESVRLMVKSFGRPDFKEGVQSFLQKRPPNFPPVDPTA